MSDYRVLRRFRFGSAVALPTGETHHFRGGRLLPPPAEVQVVDFPGSSGYYLLYLDEAGQEMTDTFHDSLADALAQAEWEFNLRDGDWEITE